jgi:hypothetical protein
MDFRGLALSVIYFTLAVVITLTIQDANYLVQVRKSCHPFTAFLQYAGNHLILCILTALPISCPHSHPFALRAGEDQQTQTSPRLPSSPTPTPFIGNKLGMPPLAKLAQVRPSF